MYVTLCHWPWAGDVWTEWMRSRDLVAEIRQTFWISAASSLHSILSSHRATFSVPIVPWWVHPRPFVHNLSLLRMLSPRPLAGQHLSILQVSADSSCSPWSLPALSRLFVPLMCAAHSALWVCLHSTHYLLHLGFACPAFWGRGKFVSSSCVEGASISPAVTWWLTHNRFCIRCVLSEWTLDKTDPMSSEPKHPASVSIPGSLPTAFPLFCPLNPSAACRLIVGILFLEFLG